ncbi:MAG: 4Fe-4S dicluster domain-containing protein [Desulfosalsimonas sp.]
METRRKFLKNGLLFSLAAGTLVSTGCARHPFKTTSGHQWAMIIDLNRCTGCQSCVIACKLQTHTAQNCFNTQIIEKETGGFPASRVVFTPLQCQHCENPPCVSACPQQATFKLANGIVVTDWSRCIADGACVDACPYGVRFPDPRFGNRVDKCDFCIDRLRQGLVPACVEACAPGARIWGDLNHPTGEFAEYLKAGGLSSLKPELGLKARVLYKTIG